MTTTDTKPCVCGGKMEFVPRHTDGEDRDGRRGWTVPAAFVCADCWRVEPDEDRKPEAADAVPGVNP